MAASVQQDNREPIVGWLAVAAAIVMAAVAVLDLVVASENRAESGRYLADLYVSLATALAAVGAWVLTARQIRPAGEWVLVLAVAVRLILAVGVTAPRSYAVLSPLYLVAIVLAQVLLGARAALGIGVGGVVMFGLAAAGVSDDLQLATQLPVVATLYLLLYLAVGAATHLLAARTAHAEARAQRLSGTYQRARIELDELQDQFRALAESAAIAIAIQQDGQLVYGNPRFAEMAKCPRSDVFGFSLWDFMAPGDVQALQAQLANPSVGPRGRIASGEILFRPPKGTARWCGIAIAEALYRQRPSLVANLLDVSDRVAAQQAVRRERDFSNSIIDTAGTIIMALDPQGRILRFNPAGERLMGYAADELRGRPYWEVFLPPDRQQAAKEEFAEILSGELNQEAETTWVTKAGEEITVAWRYGLQIASDGQVAGMVAVGIDVTQQRILEREAMMTQRLRALGQIAGGVAHDLNNMLASIMGPAELMLLDETDPDRQRDLNSIVRAARRGAETVRRIQRFAQAQTDLDRQAFDLRELAEEVILALRPRWRDAAERAGITIEVINQVPAGLIVLANSGEIGNVLMNLIVNACEAMPEGGRITITGERRGGLVEFRVSDTGVGMSEETMASIFQPFFSTKGADNSGLGLAIIRGIVSRHGGTISVSSELGIGTTFTVTLSSSRPEASAAVHAAAGGEQMGRLRILVVDDNTDVASFAAAVANRLGHEAEAVYTGEEAIERLESRPYDVLITDYGMEGLSGRAVADTARRLYPEIKTVLITGWDLSAEECDGFDGVLKKPFTLAEVREVVEKLATD